MNEVNDLTRQNRQLIAEAEQIRLRLQQALEELEEIRDQVFRRRTDERRIRDAARERTITRRNGGNNTRQA